MFQLQMGYPGITQSDSSPYKHIGDIFPGLFPSDEAFFVLWQDVPICFRYREDLAHNFAAILDMLQALKENAEGNTLLVLTNEILNLTIGMHWQADVLHLNMHVTTDNTIYEEYCAALNANNELTLDKREFIAEWHTLIHQLVLYFDAGKVCVEDGFEQQKLMLLHSLDQQLEGFGCMYTEIPNERY